MFFSAIQYRGQNKRPPRILKIEYTGLFAQAYHQIISAGYAEKSMPCGYFKSGLILSGLSAGSYKNMAR